jgi:hypothetical protein
MGARNSSRVILSLCIFITFLFFVNADLYMHNPRGSNNRLNEQSATRNNNNRVFDSQNNARGGYNVGDRNEIPGKVNNQNTYYEGSPYADLNKLYDPNNRDYNYAQYPMLYLEESELRVEWTNQHGCGGDPFTSPSKQSCRIIVQYMCETGYQSSEVGIIRGAEEIRDGWNANVNTRPNKPNTYEYGLNEGTTAGNTYNNRQNGVVRHESENYYYECSVRRRNPGLFIADQNVPTTRAATYTRQNPDATQNGLECPEERDYYPYWSPSPWKDVAIITDNDQEECDSNGRFVGKSQNNNLVYRCIPTNATPNNGLTAWQANNQLDCTSASGQWVAYTHNLTAPHCVKSDWVRNNHLGNTPSGETMHYNWKLPSFTEMANSGVRFLNNDYAKCVLRLRYNISTTDFDPNTTDFRFNGNNLSPVKTNEQVDVGSPIAKLNLNVNTAQFARTFQDRSHTFYIRRRPAKWANKRIVNLNIRGKRGNIVQNYPSVEYDFVPNNLQISNQDLIHLQWTGSNSHQNNGNGGDGQTGNDGQGQDGTDRNNFAQMLSMKENYPIPYDKFPDNIFSRSLCYQPNGTFFSSSLIPVNSSHIPTASQLPTGEMTTAAVDCAVFLWSSGYYTSRAAVIAGTSSTTTNTLDQEMNKAPASLIGGIIMEFYVPENTTYPYLSTRNNAFSNRSQKGKLVVASV